MNWRISGSALLAIIFTACAAHASPETLDYSGSLMSIVGESSFNGGPGPFALTGSLVLSTPLGMNAIDETVVPSSWSFNTPEGILSSSFASNPTNVFGGVNATFSFTTRNGAIVGWDVVASSLYSPGGPTEILSSITSEDIAGKGGDTYQGVESSQYCGEPGVLCYTASAANSTPGRWVAVPEIDGASAAGALTLLIGSLFILRGRRRAAAQ